MECSGRSTDVKATKKPNEVDHQIGQRLRKWRQAQDIDACVLAQRLGVTYQQLQKYEKGQTRIAASRLYEIARTLSVPVHWFFREPVSDEDDTQLLVDSAACSDVSAAHRSEPDVSGHRLLQHYLKIEDRDVRRALFALMAILDAGNRS